MVSRGGRQGAKRLSENRGFPSVLISPQLHHSSLPSSATNGAATALRVADFIIKKNALRSLARRMGGYYRGYMHYIYILKLSNNTFYSGYTNNLPRRIKDHESGKNISTQKFRPIRLTWYSAFPNKYRALACEHYLKTSSGKAFRNKRLL